MTTGYITTTLDTMRRKYTDGECVITANVYNSSDALTDPTANTFKWRYQFKDASDNDVTMVKSSTGIYTATFTPDRQGNIYYRITTTTPTSAKEGTISIADSKFSVSV